LPKKIDSDALGILNKSLGLTGAGSPITELQDGIVDQTLDVGPIARRGRTLQPSGGIFTAVMRNVHAGATSLTSEETPYDILAANALPPWPTPVPAQFDVWLLSASLRRVAGTGTIAATLSIRYEATQQGWGIDDSNAAVALLSITSVAFWDAVVVAGDLVMCFTSGGGGSRWPINMRLPRKPNTTLVFGSTAGAAATYVCDIILGLFPVALGQDGGF